MSLIVIPYEEENVNNIEVLTTWLKLISQDLIDEAIDQRLRRIARINEACE